MPPVFYTRFCYKANLLRDLQDNQKDKPIPVDVVKIILLTQEQYQYFSSHLREDMPFIAANRNLSRRDGNDATHCLLVTTRNIRGGILVDCQGSTYARYAAEVPDKSVLDLREVPVDHYDLQLRQPPSEPER